MSLSGRVVGLLEDDPIMGKSLVQRLALEGTIVRWWKSGSEALSELQRGQPEAVICDIRLPDMSGEDVFRQAAAAGKTPPFLFITGFGDIDQAVSLIRAGGRDYVTKPFEMPEFLDRLQSILRAPAEGAEAVLGRSPQMQAITKTLARVARMKTPVLLTGETGVGKEVCANSSTRRWEASCPSWRSIAPPFRRICLRLSSSVTSVAPSPAPTPVTLDMPSVQAKGRSSSTRSVTFLKRCSRNYFDCWKSGSSPVSAARSHCPSKRAWCAPQMPTSHRA